MKISLIAGYKFIELHDLTAWRDYFLEVCHAHFLKGTILLSHEGINLNIAGFEQEINAFKKILDEQTLFANIAFHETFSSTLPFKRLKIKIKKEIITFRQTAVDVGHQRAPSLSPEQFKQWLDEKRDITILDTRNDYEVELGTFKGAVNLHLQDFTSFSVASAQLPHNKPIVMFCTGGIRCEKAALYLLNQGYPEVYQLDGGILGYFAKIGGEHYDGTCFVFDERVALDSALKAKTN